MPKNARIPSVESLLATVAPLPPEAQPGALRAVLADVRRRINVERHPTPGSLATTLRPALRQTPALELIDRHIRDTIDTGGRLIVTVPPQEGKSSRVAIWTPVWALVRDPDTRIVVASYAETLARRNSHAARDLVAEFGTGATDPVTGLPLEDHLGIRVAEGRATAASWGVEGREGGYYATGVGGSLTGRAADLLIVDDPVKNMAEADSAREREKVWEWWTSVASTRLAPGAAVIIIMTRWHEDDLAGRLIAQDEKRGPDDRVWQVVNIPAIAEAGVPDALGREPGEALESARGRTLREFEMTRDSVGARTWSALYQGSPTPTEGGLFRRDDFDRHRTDSADLVGRIITVDPAESGHGDEAGLLTMGWDADGRAYVTGDYSRPMRSEAWARNAVLLAVRTGAGDLLFEAFTAKDTYLRVIERAWEDLRDEVAILDAADGDEVEAARRWHESGNRGNSLGVMQTAKEHAEYVRGHTDPPFRVVPWRAPGDKVARAAGARQGVETGRLRLAGTFPVLETQAVTWQPGQGSPDRVDAMVNGYEHIMATVGATGFDIASPFG